MSWISSMALDLPFQDFPGPTFLNSVLYNTLKTKERRQQHCFYLVPRVKFAIYLCILLPAYLYTYVPRMKKNTSYLVLVKYLCTSLPRYLDTLRKSGPGCSRSAKAHLIFIFPLSGKIIRADAPVVKKCRLHRQSQQSRTVHVAVFYSRCTDIFMRSISG